MDMKRFILLILLVTLFTGTAWAGVRLDWDDTTETGADEFIVTGNDTLEGETGGEAASLALGEVNAELQTPSLTASLVASHDSALTLETVMFDASGSHAEDSSITLYEWDLDGDGEFDTSSASEILEHTYISDGVVLVQVRVTDSLGQSALSEALQLHIVNRLPIARFYANLGGAKEGSHIQFTDYSHDEDGVISSWSYDFGDGTTSNEANPSHSYDIAGVFQVALSVADDDGASSGIYVFEIEIPNLAPQAEFTLQQSTLNVGQPLIVIDESTDLSVDGEIVHVAWDFGDGTYQAGGPSSDNVYSHVFTVSGIYTITLYVIDNDGSMALTQSTIQVL